jgi:hypothetical protein
MFFLIGMMGPYFGGRGTKRKIKSRIMSRNRIRSKSRIHWQ